MGNKKEVDRVSFNGVAGANLSGLVGSSLDEAPALRSHACFLPVLDCDLLNVCSFPPC